MRRPLLPLFTLILGFILACSGGTATGNRKKKQGKQKHPNAIVEAYAADCHHVFEPEDEMDEGNDNECSALNYDQNCSPDPSGCWDKGEACVSNCGGSCNQCQDRCANTCDDCKSGCEGDGKCERKCASKRSSCRDTCMGEKSSCANEVCPGSSQQCYDNFDAKVTKRCPDCEAIRDCIVEAWNNETDWQSHCKKPGNGAECTEWCMPGM